MGTRVVESQCPYHPEDTDGAVGMHHCPVCGEMVVAGIPHPNYEWLEVHLKAISTLRFGDLVILDDGQYAVVDDPLVDARSETIRVFQGNGLRVDVGWANIYDVAKLPDSEAHVNFAEWMHINPA